MSRNFKIILFSVMLMFSYYLKQEESYISFDDSQTPKVISKTNNNPTNKKTSNSKQKGNAATKKFIQPKNGFSPYDYFFGKGIYSVDSENYVLIDNQTNKDAVVLLVNSSSGKKIRNEYVRMQSSFKMTKVPDGTYYLRYISGNKWDSEKYLGELKGSFSKNLVITGNSDVNDWMKLGVLYADSEGRYTEGYSQTLHAVSGGNVESENLTPDEFIN
tara:strand:+ start:689 stop:1336 length:648 start_codon:yes stop_codon:yes gene_type:complete